MLYSSGYLKDKIDKDELWAYVDDEIVTVSNKDQAQQTIKEFEVLSGEWSIKIYRNKTFEFGNKTVFGKDDGGTLQYKSRLSTWAQ